MNLLHLNHSRYLDNQSFLQLIGASDICILSDFLLDPKIVDAFWDRYYARRVPRIVVCGINPGRFGAGKTGIPFLDFASLSQLMPGVDRHDSEKSAAFFCQVIQSYGSEAFFRDFYVTNVASVGFLRDGRNLNYHDLPAAAQATVEANFCEEMKMVNPTQVISLGTAVQHTARKLLSPDIDCSLRLPHPAWVATYRSRETEQWVSDYVEALKSAAAATSTCSRTRP